MASERAIRSFLSENNEPEQRTRFCLFGSVGRLNSLMNEISRYFYTINMLGYGVDFIHLSGIYEGLYPLSDNDPKRCDTSTMEHAHPFRYLISVL